MNVEELVATLQDRIAKLEQQVAALSVAPAPAAPKPEPTPAPAAVAPAATLAEDEISPEVLAVISAAICAFLGKKARIRRVRRIYSTGINPWSQQGRVFIQGSHNLTHARH